ncbi:MAG TPA: pyrimidine 5'-nucleotidase, partial [Afifellaceae bacterium]|nr:pyrimidine 5'-nucleotidase [Afifellaceae bacterium]
MNKLTVETLAPHAPRELTAFSGVDAWIFDLDNTLYPRHVNLYQQVDARIRAYVQKLLNVSEDEAQRLQKGYYRDHGTTLRGLMIQHAVDVDEFLEFVHDIDHSAVAPDPVLGDAIARLPGRKFIFTNGSKRHAEKVAERLGVTRHFEAIFDIAAGELVPKP